MNCPECQSEQILNNGKARLQNHRSLQKSVCKACGQQFNERTGTPMSRLRSTPESLSGHGDGLLQSTALNRGTLDEAGLFIPHSLADQCQNFYPFRTPGFAE